MMGMDETVDRLAIQEVIYRYSDSVTRGVWERTGDTFAAGAVWECPALKLRFASPELFVNYLRSTIASDAVLIQVAHGSAIDLIGPDAATATTTIHEIVRSSSANGELWGVFFDELSRYGDEWKFTRRLLIPLYTEAGTIDGTQLARRPVLRPGE